MSALADITDLPQSCNVWGVKMEFNAYFRILKILILAIHFLILKSHFLVLKSFSNIKN